MNKILSKNRSHYLLVLLILILAIFMRMYKVDELLYFMIDEGRYSFLMKRLYLDKKLMLAGVAIPGGIYLGPAYFYFTGFLLLIFNFDFLKMGYLASLVGVISTLSIYYLAKNFFNKKTGLIAMFLYSFLYLIVIYNRIYWTLAWTSLASIFTYWALYKIIRFKKYWFLLPLSLVFILGSQSDASYFSLIVTSIVLLIKHKPKNIKKPLLISLLIFISAQLPLIAFDLRHDLYNTKIITKLFSFKAINHTPSLLTSAKALLVIPQTLGRLVLVLPPWDVTYQLSPPKATVAQRLEVNHPLIQLIGLALLLVFLIRKWSPKQSFKASIIKTHIYVCVFGIIAYSLVFPGYTHEWFITILFPAIVIAFASSLSLMLKGRFKYIITLLLIALSMFHIQALIKTQNDFGYKHKAQAVKYAIDQVGDQTFYLDSLGSQAYGGFRYLFWNFKKEPAHSYMDSMYANWIYPQPEPDINTDLGVVMLNFSSDEKEKPDQIIKANKLRRAAIKSQKFGGIEVLIIPNSTD